MNFIPIPDAVELPFDAGWDEWIKCKDLWEILLERISV